MTTRVNILVLGAIWGALYSLIAVGFTLIFGVAGIINLAHGAFYMLGAYLAYTFMSLLEINVSLSALMAVVGVALIAMLIDRFGIRPMRERHVYVLIITLAFALFFQELMYAIYGPHGKPVKSFVQGDLILGDVHVSYQKILTFLVAGVVAIVFLLSRIDGGASAVVALAGNAGKLQIFNWGPVLSETGLGKFLETLLTDPNIFVLATLNGFFGSMAAFGTDQELMQRLLTVETRKESQKTMLMTPLGSFLVMGIFLIIGACLYTYYVQHPGMPLPEKLDGIFPHFIEQAMPPWMRGLMLAAIVMASIDSPLGSLTSSFVTDIYRPVIYKSATERHYLFTSRVCVVMFGIILAFIAYFFSHFEKILWLAFKIGGVTYGSLLGVFLLGLLTTVRCNRINVVAMTFSALAMLILLILSEKNIFPLGWTWLLLMGTFLTFATGYLFGKKPSSAMPMDLTS